MAGGKALHSALEAEVKVAAEVEVATREDAWAVRLLDTLACLRQLRKQGLTREVYVFGNIQVPALVFCFLLCESSLCKD